MKHLEDDSDQSGFEDEGNKQEQESEGDDEVMQEEEEAEESKEESEESKEESEEIEEDQEMKEEIVEEDKDQSEENEGDKEDDNIASVYKEPELDESIKASIQKTVLSLLNKLSDGNIDIIFKDLYGELSKYAAYPVTLSEIYFKVFKKFCIEPQMLNSAILSVNCLMITALQRLIGQSFFAPIINEMYKIFIKSHEAIHSEKDITHSQIALKNLISIFTHFYMFESITHSFIFDVIKHLLKNFKEKDIEMLLNLLHNIGVLLRKDSPSLCKDIILLFESKKIEAKISAPKSMVQNNPQGNVSSNAVTPFERKVKFLGEELKDIRNNKKESKYTLKFYLNWLKTNSEVKSEILKNPLEINFKTIQESKEGFKWWLTDEEMQKYESSLKISEIEQKIDRNYLAELEAAAKAQHYSSDIQKSVFYTLMSSDDYLDAFQNIQKLGLKKKQEREIIKVNFGFF